MKICTVKKTKEKAEVVLASVLPVGQPRGGRAKIVHFTGTHEAKGARGLFLSRKLKQNLKLKKKKTSKNLWTMLH